MKAKELPSLEYLNECFELDPTSSSGLKWKIRPNRHFSSKRIGKGFNTRFSGKDAGCIVDNKLGHKCWKVLISGEVYHAHRIIYYMIYKNLEIYDVIDHKDYDALNNKIDNIRLATKAQNNFHVKIRKDNSSGYKGVFKNYKGWGSKISVNKEIIYLGTFRTKEEAHVAYCAASKKYHGEFGRTA